MRHGPSFFAFDVRCPTADEASRLEGLLRRNSEPDAVLVDRVTSAGVTSEVRHRVGDYFEAVRIIPGIGGDPSVFRCLFHRHPRAGRFWKDVMVRLIRMVERASPETSVALVYKGDECLDWSRLTLV